MITAMAANGGDGESVTSRNKQLSTVQSHTASAVTKSDSTVLAFSALYVGGAGDVAIQQATDGSVITFVGVPAGTILPVYGVRVMAATTATNIVALA